MAGRWNGTESNGLVGGDGLIPELAGWGFLRERERGRGEEREGEREREGGRERGRERERREREREKEHQYHSHGTCTYCDPRIFRGESPSLQLLQVQGHACAYF